MTASETLASVDRREPAARSSPMLDQRITAVLGSRRAALVFGAIVFATTLIQVLANPFVITFDGAAQWTHPLSIVVVVAIVTAGSALQAVSLLLSARWPALAVLGSLAAYLVLVVVVAVPNWLSAMELVVAIALFLLATRRSIGFAFGVLAAAVALDLLVISVWVVSLGSSPAAAVGFVVAQGIAFAAPAAGATALGIWWGIQSRRVTRAQEEAEAASREHEARIEQAREHERARIAQELHDVAGQHLAGLISLADAAISVGPARAEDMLQLVEDVRAEGRFAAASLYGALADLRAVGAAQVEATRDLMRIPDLVAYWRQRGMPVDIHTTGDLADLPAVVSTTAYRGVQEALTNAAKHAPGAHVDIDIVLDGEWLRVVVANDPSRAERPAGERVGGLGWGLDGLRNRLDLMSGSVTAGRTDEGGWKVRMRIPFVEAESRSGTG
jgi:signal transduction histidine kinase